MRFMCSCAEKEANSRNLLSFKPALQQFSTFKQLWTIGGGGGHNLTPPPPAPAPKPCYQDGWRRVCPCALAWPPPVLPPWSSFKAASLSASLKSTRRTCEWRSRLESGNFEFTWMNKEAALKELHGGRTGGGQGHTAKGRSVFTLKDDCGTLLKKDVNGCHLKKFIE